MNVNWNQWIFLFKSKLRERERIKCNNKAPHYFHFLQHDDFLRNTNKNLITFPMKWIKVMWVNGARWGKRERQLKSWYGGDCCCCWYFKLSTGVYIVKC